MSISNTEVAREARARRQARKQGLILEKARTRQVQAAEYGTFMIIDAGNNGLVQAGLPHGYGLTLDDVEAALAAP